MARSRGPVRRAAPVQSRSASSMAAPAAHAPPAPAPAAHTPMQAAPQQPGLFAQMASTAAGVAVGSAVGHTIGAGITGLFSGSGSAPAEAQPQQLAAAPVQQDTFQTQARHCDTDARNFTRCLEDNNGNFQICDYYLQQLKACQEASRQY
ncbi:AaceriACL010Cp [[Ashbya] aceris (nom. inval.)]|nr:AaceriACL010Cp [[Ashbya] aceris (nom. inval.)]